MEKRYYFGLQNIGERGNDLWWWEKKKKWANWKEIVKDKDYGYYCSTYHVNTLRAAIAHLKRHNEIPKGTKFRLISQYIGKDRILTKKW